MAVTGPLAPPPGGGTMIVIKVVVTYWILEVIAISLCVARIITRLRRNSKLFIEDYLIIGATVGFPPSL
jgi:hypothetical protein